MVRTRYARTLSFVGLVAALGACRTTGQETAAQPPVEGPAVAASATANERASRPPKKKVRLPEGARTLVAREMYLHGVEMTNLLWAVLFLDVAAAQEITSEIASSPRLATPDTNDASELNTQIPPVFFELQARMRDRTRVLKGVLAEEPVDVERVAESFGSLTATCVKCHEMFLYEDDAEESLDDIEG
jgi:cytochrome c556